MIRLINVGLGFRIIQIILLMALMSCQDHQEPVIKQVRFSVGWAGETRTSDGRLQNLADPAGVLVTIQDGNGNIVKELEWLDLYKFGDGYLSKPMTLTTEQGQLYLSEFFVLDQNQSVLYTTPREGSMYAHLVADPLDIEFSIHKDEITTVTPEVVEIDETSIPFDFGYGQFGFKVVNKIQTVFSSFITGDSNFELTEANLKIEGLNDSTDTTALWIYETHLEAKANIVIIREANAYRITATKQGYQSWTTTTSLMNNDKVEIIFERSDSNFETIWNKNYGGASNDFNSRTISTSDGGILILSTSSSNDHDVTSNLGNLDAWIVKLNPSGAIEWTKNYGTSAPDWATSMVESSDGSGYLVTGYTYGYSTENEMEDNGWMFKISSSGNIMWEKNLGTPRYTSAAAAHTTGNFIVTCWGSNTNELIFSSIKELNSTGEIVWEKSLPFHSSGDGIIVGTNDGYIGTYNRTTYKVNLQGDMQWTLGDGFKIKSSHVKFFPNAEGYIVIGNEYPKSNNPNQYHPEYAFIAQLNQQGQVIWENKIKLPEELTVTDAILNANGNYLIVGWQYASEYETEPWLGEVTTLGDVIRQKTMKGNYQGSYYPSAYFKRIISQGDRFLVTGQTNMYGKDSPKTNYGHTDVWATMIKF